LISGLKLSPFEYYSHNVNTTISICKLQTACKCYSLCLIATVTMWKLRLKCDYYNHNVSITICIWILHIHNVITTTVWILYFNVITIVTMWILNYKVTNTISDPWCGHEKATGQANKKTEDVSKPIEEQAEVGKNVFWS